MVFGLNTGKHFLVEVSLRLIDRPYIPLKNGANALRLKDRHVFMWRSLGILKVFNTLTLKQVIWKTKNFFLQNGVRFFGSEYYELTFSYKSALSKANVKKNWMGSSKWTCQKTRIFATVHFIFLNNQLESIRTSYIKSRTLTFQKNI